MAVCKLFKVLQVEFLKISTLECVFQNQWPKTLFACRREAKMQRNKKVFKDIHKRVNEALMQSFHF